MANAGFLGISLLAYASWQTLHFLNDRVARVWAKQRYHRYHPRPTAANIKKGISCRSCSHYEFHPDFHHSGICSHEDWKVAMRSEEVMVKREGSCELWKKTSLPLLLRQDRELSPDQWLFSEAASEFPLR